MWPSQGCPSIVVLYLSLEQSRNKHNGKVGETEPPAHIKCYTYRLNTLRLYMNNEIIPRKKKNPRSNR